MDAYSVYGINPSIQNVVKGARYCGKRGGEAFSKVTRPQYKQNEDKYKCPDGWSPCNSNVAIDSQTAEYITCRPDNISEADYCPITSFALDLNSVDQAERSKYTEVELLRGGVAVPNRSIWFSKHVVQHAINVIRI